MIKKIVFVSDSHEQEFRMRDIPDGDLFVHCGDITWNGSIAALFKFNMWLGRLPHRHKIVIAGNHDWIFEKANDLGRSILSNAIYLQDSGVEIEGLRIWGSPWTPAFNNWAFNANDEIVRYWDMIPLDVQLLITHGPPKGILDVVPGERGYGCPRLMAKIQQIKPAIHAFGHVHEGYGKQFFNGTEFINAAVLGERTLNLPLVWEGEWN